MPRPGLHGLRIERKVWPYGTFCPGKNLLCPVCDSRLFCIVQFMPFPMNSLPSVVLLKEHLSLAGVANADEAAKRILEDVARFGMEDFRLGEKFPVPRGVVVEYTFGRTGYSIDNAHPQRAPDFYPSDHGGTQLNSDNIRFFLRVSEIAGEIVPDLWLNPDSNLIGKIRTPRQHLDSLNEFWWLSRWNRPFTVQPNYRMHNHCDLDVDWRLTWDFGLHALSVNMDAKRRCDVLRYFGKSIKPNEIFEAGVIDKRGRSKFRPSGPDEINVLGLTVIGEINREVQKYAEKWLKTRDDVDAILLFSRFSDRKAGFDLHVQRKQELLSQVLNRALDDKDTCLHGRIQCPLPFTLSQLRFVP